MLRTSCQPKNFINAIVTVTTILNAKASSLVFLFPPQNICNINLYYTLQKCSATWHLIEILEKSKKNLKIHAHLSFQISLPHISLTSLSQNRAKKGEKGSILYAKQIQFSKKNKNSSHCFSLLCGIFSINLFFLICFCSHFTKINYKLKFS